MLTRNDRHGNTYHIVIGDAETGTKVYHGFSRPALIHRSLYRQLPPLTSLIRRHEKYLPRLRRHVVADVQHIRLSLRVDYNRSRVPYPRLRIAALTCSKHIHGLGSRRRLDRPAVRTLPALPKIPRNHVVGRLYCAPKVRLLGLALVRLTGQMQRAMIRPPQQSCLKTHIAEAVVSRPDD